MDNASLDSLLAAYHATPENKHLVPVLLRAFWDRGEPRRAWEEVLSREKATDWPAEAEITLPVEICLELGEYYKALTYAESQEPAVLILRARAFLGLDLFDEAREAYKQALSMNAALEDIELSKKLLLRTGEEGFAIASPAESPGRRDEDRVPIISTDDSTAVDLQRVLEPERDRVTFTEVGGLDAVKKEIHKRIILPFLKPGLFERFKRRSGGGILLYGPPGCGKTLLARATAGECEANFYNVSISDVLSMWMGESEQRLAALFEKARQETPSVLFFDEIEALGGKRKYNQDGLSAKLVSQFLSEMDGFAQNNQGVLILAATNVPWSVDPAFRRPGRFDRVLFVPPPDREAREAILRIHLSGRPGADALDVRSISETTSGFSGADLFSLIEAATDLAIEASIDCEEECPIREEYLKQARKETKSTTLEWLTTARNYARYANESGHYDEVLAFLKKYGRS